MTQPAQYGISTRGDVLVNQTADGVDLNAVWDEFRDLLDVWNRERTSLTDLLIFRTTATGEAVPQNVAVPSFEAATDLGVPKSANVPGDALLLGYTFKDWDLAGRFSWRFLRDADLRQVESVMDCKVWFRATNWQGLVRRILADTNRYAQNRLRIKADGLDRDE